MKINKILLSVAAIFAFQGSVMAQEAPADDTTAPDSVLTGDAYNDGVTSIDSLNIDAEINVEGGIFFQRNARGDIGSLTLMELDASDVDITRNISIAGETHLGDSATISEGNVHLSGDMGSVAINQTYSRSGTVQISHGAKLNLGNVLVPR